jgi:hypothetical protein
MNHHLSQEQFAKCFVGETTEEEHQHLLNCTQCAAELEQFGGAISSLRQAIRTRVDDHVPSPISLPSKPQRMPAMRWALVAVVVLIVGTIPFLTRRPAEPAAPAAAESPEDLMNAIDAHLSRTMPSPMEPMMSLFPDDESKSE